jgi:hypothetical protein
MLMSGRMKMVSIEKTMAGESLNLIRISLIEDLSGMAQITCTPRLPMSESLITFSHLQTQGILMKMITVSTSPLLFISPKMLKVIKDCVMVGLCAL